MGSLVRIPWPEAFLKLRVHKQLYFYSLKYIKRQKYSMLVWKAIKILPAGVLLPRTSNNSFIHGIWIRWSNKRHFITRHNPFKGTMLWKNIQKCSFCCFRINFLEVLLAQPALQEKFLITCITSEFILCNCRFMILLANGFLLFSFVV